MTATHKPGDMVYLTPTTEHRDHFNRVGAPDHHVNYPATVVGVSEGDGETPTRYNVHAFTDSHHGSHYFIGVHEDNLSKEYHNDEVSE